MRPWFHKLDNSPGLGDFELGSALVLNISDIPPMSMHNLYAMESDAKYIQAHSSGSNARSGYQ